MENTSVYYRQLVLHGRSIETCIDGWQSTLNYHKEMVALAEKQLKDMRESLKITKDQIALEEQQDGKS